jgi:hypothetical protein
MMEGLLQRFFKQFLEEEFSEVRNSKQLQTTPRMCHMADVSAPCLLSHSAALANTAGLTSPALREGGRVKLYA